MKQFQVTTEPQYPHGFGPRDHEIISADYMKLEGGHLIFRQEVRHSYPETIRVFAPGSWIECKFVGHSPEYRR